MSIAVGEIAVLYNFVKNVVVRSLTQIHAGHITRHADPTGRLYYSFNQKLKRSCLVLLLQ